MTNVMEKVKWGIMIESDWAEGLPEEGILKLILKEWEAGSHEETAL